MVENSKKFLLTGGTGITCYEYLYCKFDAVLHHNSCIVADDLGRTGRAKGSLSSHGSKEGFSVHMGIHCGGSVA